ncbi:MAG: GNAT family N-acetyltransferase [Thermoplasmata archaeon]|nr:GNAT family N-acetyltransferase [Thermoplasmata archaeon]
MSPPPVALRPTSELPGETKELLERFRAETPRTVEDDWAMDTIQKHLAAGNRPGFLLLGPKDEAIGILLDRVTPIGHRLSVLLAPGFRSPPSARAVLVAAESSAELRPLVGIRILARGPPPSAVAEHFEPRGFRFLGREDLELPDDVPLPVDTPANPRELRPLRATDATALARLMFAAYSTDPYDVAIFLEHQDFGEDCVASVAALLSAKYGPWIPAGSFVREVDGELLGAVLTVQNDGGLIAELLVDPRARRTGLGRALLWAAARGLRGAGHRPVRLVFTKPNRPAEALYLSMGFRPPVPPAAGGDWVNLERVGHPEIAEELRLAPSRDAGTASALLSGEGSP